MNLEKRRIQGWLLLAYGLSIFATNFTDHGVWRHVVLSIAACVLAMVVSLLVWARLLNGCDRSRDGQMVPSR